MTELFIPSIEFSDDAIDSAVYVLRALSGYVVDLEIPGNSGYPSERVHIARVDEDGDVVVNETDEAGTPLVHSTWAIPVNFIKKVTVL